MLREAGDEGLEAAVLAAATAALHLACAGGHGRLVKLLLRKGAALDGRDAQGRTPLHAAVMHSHRGVAAHLLQAGADASLRDASGASAADLIAAWAAQGQGLEGGGLASDV